MPDDINFGYVTTYLLAALFHDAQAQHHRLALRGNPLYMTGSDFWLRENESKFLAFSVICKFALIASLVIYAITAIWWYAVVLWVVGIPLGLLLMLVVDATVGLRRLSMLAFVVEPILLMTMFASLWLGK